MPRWITADDSAYALDLAKRVCLEVGPGMPGTPQERARAALIERELSAHLGPENVTTEEFTVAPWAMLSAYPLSAVLLLLAAVLNLAASRLPQGSSAAVAALGLLVAVLAPAPFILLFIYNYEWLDSLFRQKTSVNVIGVLRRPGAQEVRHLLLLGSHHDSAPENTWLSLLRYGFVAASATWTLGFVVMLGASLLQAAGAAAGHAGLVAAGNLGWLPLVYPILPAVIFGLFFNRGRRGGGTVPGAADNLSVCGVVAAMCRFLVENPTYIPEDTEIRFVAFGCEEAGLRGSRRYVERHLAELKRLDARMLNYEVLANPQLSILTSDMNGTVKHSPAMVRSVVAAAQRAGVPYRVSTAGIGTGSDAGSFSEAGLKAATLLGMTFHQMIAFYHQERDRPEVLTAEPLLNALKITLAWVQCGGEG